VKETVYTTRLAVGQGLVAETLQLLDLWQIGMERQDLLKAALESGQFPSLTARRIKNIVTEAFAPRYLVDEALPARLLKVLAGSVPTSDIKQLFYLYTCRANLVLFDYVRNVYWERYSAGGQFVSKKDTLDFVMHAVSDGMTTTHWSETTIANNCFYLMSACTDFGLLGPKVKDERPIITFRPTPLVTSFLCHDLHFKGLGDNAILNHEDWRLFGLNPEDILSEFKQLALRGEMIVQSAGAVVQISWKAKSMEELVNGFVDS